MTKKKAKYEVECVTPHDMHGKNYIERLLNAYLTNTFILGHNVPADECLAEVKDILKMTDTIQIAIYLRKKFGSKKDSLIDYETNAQIIFAVITNTSIRNYS